MFGFLLAVAVHPANVQDKSGGAMLLERCAKCFSRLQVIFADGAYVGPTMQAACADHHGSRLEVVKRNELHRFEVLPKRWIVERTLAWLGRNRRLSKDYEELIEMTEAFVILATIRLIAGRLA
jgi:transposase